MSPELIFHTQTIHDPIKDHSDVNKTTFLVKPPSEQDWIDRSYYFKKPGINRSRDLGELEYEERGYQLLEAFRIPVPEHGIYTMQKIPVLATNLAEGVPLHALSDVQLFHSALDQTLSQHFEMWKISEQLRRINRDIFLDIHITNPLVEALDTAIRIETTPMPLYNVPNKFTKYVKQVVHNLSTHRNLLRTSDNQPLFLQHGEEMLIHHIYNPNDDTLKMIDPTLRLTSRMERALNRLLGGSLIFNFEINDDGIPNQIEKSQTLIACIKKYAQMIEELNHELGIKPKSVLKELVFINVARVAYGIYNPENKAYFDTMDLNKFIKLAINLYEELSR